MTTPLTLFGSAEAFIAWQRREYRLPNNTLFKRRRTIQRFLHWLTVEDTDDASLVDVLRIGAYLRGLKQHRTHRSQFVFDEQILRDWHDFVHEHMRAHTTPATQAKLKQPKTKVKNTSECLSSQELDLILGALAHSHKPEDIMVMLGLRLMHDHLIGSDAQRTIRLSEVNMAEGTLSHQGETVLFTRASLAALVRYLDQARPTLIARLRRQKRKAEQYTLLFLGTRGGLVGEDWLPYNLKRCAELTKIEKEVAPKQFLRAAKARRDKS